MTMHKDVNLESRYCDKGEFDRMKAMVDRCGPLAALVEEIFCDSKACDSYTVTLRPERLRDSGKVIAKAVCEVVGLRCQEAAYAAREGHNGILVSVSIHGQDVSHEMAAGSDEENYIDVDESQIPPLAPLSTQPVPAWCQPAGDPGRQ
jgi:hypothetical protein